MKNLPPNPALAELAQTLADWVSEEALKSQCAQWAAYWIGEREKPTGKTGYGQPLKDSDFHVFSDALACVKMGWASKSEFHAERVARRTRANPVLDKFPTAARVGVPQVRDGKE